MSLASKLLSASGGAVDKLYVDDVFSAYTYTGNGSTQTINNGIDLAGKGGLVWVKRRDGSAASHVLTDTARGVGQTLYSESTVANQNYGATGLTAFNGNGFSLAPNSEWNATGLKNVGWTFRKAPKFFDVVTYTGNGVDGQTISHSLGTSIGLCIVKRTDAAGDWICRVGGGYWLRLNTTEAQQSNPTDPTLTNGYPTFGGSSVFSLYAGSTGRANVNASGATYVAYLFAHDASADGIVQCGSFTTDGSGKATVNLGWEPQYVLFKYTNSAGNWFILDTSRGLLAAPSTSDAYLLANTAGAEGALGATVAPNATGFSFGGFGASISGVYLAIRRPNKPPTLGTQVYSAIARTGTGAAATVTGVGFAPDLAMIADRGRVASATTRLLDRLRGATQEIRSQTTGAEATDATGLTAFGSDGVMFGAGPQVNSTSQPYINHFFKRAPGVFDICCYTGTGVAKTEAHGLGAVPELIIVKSRSAATEGEVYLSSLGNDTALNLFFSGGGAAFTTSGLAWNYTTPTAAAFSLGTWNKVNGTSVTFVAYLFATKIGVSKCGSYTGNGSSLTIDCGFTTGARFVMIKRTDAAGDWYIWDTVRGLVAGNDPHLSLNTTAAEVTTNDSIDPANAGFIVNQLAATNINVTSATYLYLAFA